MISAEYYLMHDEVSLALTARTSLHCLEAGFRSRNYQSEGKKEQNFR
jgi:hypothetical protein